MPLPENHDSENAEPSSQAMVFIDSYHSDSNAQNSYNHTSQELVSTMPIAY